MVLYSMLWFELRMVAISWPEASVSVVRSLAFEFAVSLFLAASKDTGSVNFLVRSVCINPAVAAVRVMVGGRSRGL